LEHTLAYALAGAALAFGYRGMDFRLLRLVGLSAGSVVLEILQAFVPGRSPSALDAMAGSSGAALGMLLGAVLSKLFVPTQGQ
jgi:VanZ family protein